jgi:RimJ/RimL family protein N-acetyltransferase
VEVVTLPSGRRVRIRPIQPDDGLRLKAAYDLLSPESKYRRFLTIKPHLTESDVHYLTVVDGSDHAAFVATSVDDPERILAVARFVRRRDDPGSAELAIVVGDPYQGEGLGTELLGRLGDRALACGIARFQATVLADNVPIHRMLRHGVAHERHLGPIDEVEVELAAA